MALVSELRALKNVTIMPKISAFDLFLIDENTHN